MKHSDLPEWIQADLMSLGVEERDYPGGLIELEFWLRVVASEATKHATDAKSLADTVSKYRDHVQMIGTMGMVASAMDSVTKK